MKFPLFVSITALFLAAGCTQDPAKEIDHLVAQSVATRPATPDESLETLELTSRSIDVALRTIDENIANAKTTAYKSQHVLYQSGRLPMIRTDPVQGSMDSTGGRLDLGIQGSGFFTLKLLGGGVGYTRCGALFRNVNGDLIFGVDDGYEFAAKITVPPNVPDDNIAIGQDGIVEYIAPGASIKTRAGQIQLARFANIQGLKRMNGSIYLATDNSGPAMVDNPGDNGAGTLLAGFLEGSNVDLTNEELRRVVAEKWRNVIDRAVARASEPR